MARVRDSSLAAFPGRTAWNPYVRSTYWEPPIVEGACGKTTARSHRQQSKARNFNSTAVQFQLLPAAMNQSRSPHNGVDCHRPAMRHKSRKQDESFRNGPHAVKHNRSFSECSSESFSKQFVPGKSKQYPKGNLGRSVLNSPGFLNQCARLRGHDIITDSLGSCDSRPGSSDESIANHSPIPQLDAGSPDNFGYFRIFDEIGVCNSSFFGAGRGEPFEDLNKNFLKIDLSDVNDSYSELLSPMRIQSPIQQPMRSPSAHADVLNVPFIPLITKELEIENDVYFRQPICEQRAFSPGVQKDASGVPLIRNELEEDDYNQVSPIQIHSPSAQSDASNVALIPPKELEIAKEASGYSEQQSPACEQRACSPNVQADALNVSLTSLMSRELEMANGAEKIGSERQLLACEQQCASAEQDVPNASLMAMETEAAREVEKDQSPDCLLKQTYCCSDHPFTEPFYCQTCCKPICRDCAVHCVRKHVTIELVDFIEITQRQAEDVLIEAYLGIDVLADDMENMGIVEARRWKFEALQEKYLNLKEDRNRLSQAISALKCAIHDSRLSALVCNPDDLLKRKDMVLAEIWQIRQNRKTKARAGREENWISFRSSDSSVLPAIANGGTVVLTGPGTIGDHKINHDYKSQQFFPYGLNEIVMQSIPRGYAIASYGSNIVLPSWEPELYVKSTSVQIIGHFGDESPDNLCRPWGVTCDKDGNIIVSDRSNNRIQIYREDGTLVRRFGTYGNGPCQFNRPAGIAVDARRRLIVVDKDNHRVQILTMEGEFLRSFGEHGERQGQFSYPWDVAVNSNCEIAVTDTRNHRIQLFSPEGIPLRMFGGQPHLLRYLDSPRGICFNNDGKLIVTDFNNHHVLIIEYNMTEMRILRCEKESKSRRHGENDGGESGDGQNDENTPAFQRPQGVIAADDGSILVADSRHNSIKAFNSIGTLIYTYMPGQEEMDRPLGVALYCDGRMAFTDYGRNYVRLVRLENHVNPIPRNAIMSG
nr:PREDICTED: E3 ubiquitin-protein ligase TRIM71 isoform X2 [Linepithema humile]